MTVESLGSYLREQRVAAELSLRQLAEQAGVSNPYLSQIERGLRRPSAEVLQALAKALRISAEQVYVQAGILSPDHEQVRSVELAILGDPLLSERQKQALLEIYEAFRAVTVAQRDADLSAPQLTELLDEEPAPTDVEAGAPGSANPREGS
jgi:transcriptional regulator with XRE-family HTH domain